MNEAERLIYLIYGLLFSEESRLEFEVYNSFEILKRCPKDSYLISKYLATVQRYEDFKIFQRKVVELLKCF